MEGGLRPEGLPSKYGANTRMNTMRGACCAMLMIPSRATFSSSSTDSQSGVNWMPAKERAGRKSRQAGEQVRAVESQSWLPARHLAGIIGLERHHNKTSP